MSNHSSSADFITAMRAVASSVSVVTTDGPAGRHGATVSSFCSVSADPPTILVCLKMSSRIAQLVQANKAFKLNILPQGAQDLANRFAGRDSAADRFDGIPVTGTLPGLPGATTMTCQLSNAIESGTHLVCFGSVNEIETAANLPLTYHAGGYHTLHPAEAS